jgi:hypothetical protein
MDSVYVDEWNFVVGTSGVQALIPPIVLTGEVKSWWCGLNEANSLSDMEVVLSTIPFYSLSAFVEDHSDSAGNAEVDVMNSSFHQQKVFSGGLSGYLSSGR